MLVLGTLGQDLASSRLATSSKWKRGKYGLQGSKQTGVRTGRFKLLSLVIILSAVGKTFLLPSHHHLPHSVFDLLGLWEKQAWETSNALVGAQDRTSQPLTPSACCLLPPYPEVKVLF